MKRGRKKDWDYIWNSNNREIHLDNEIMEDWLQDWLERDKDSRWMSEEQFAKHEIEKKKINSILADLSRMNTTLASLLKENASKIIIAENFKN